MLYTRMIISLSISLCMLFIGCAGKSNIEIQKKLIAMSDTELINHYEMLELRLINIDRNREQSIDQEHDIYGSDYPGDVYCYLGHLHIADDWNSLRKEKKLTQREIKKRGLSHPQ